MQIADFSNSSSHTEGLQFRTICREDRARTSGPGLRAFAKVTDQLALSLADRISVLGDPGQSTYYRWMKKAHDEAPITLSLDTLLRVSAILGIYKALAILFEDRNQAMVWLEDPHHGTHFAGTSPMAHMLDGGHDGLISVRRYLDAWCEGHISPETPECGFEPVTERDLVWTAQHR